VWQAAPPQPPQVVVTLEPVGKGVWWLAGSGNHRSVVLEFDDRLVLYDAPLNEARTKAVIELFDCCSIVTMPDRPRTRCCIVRTLQGGQQ
jgi:hypothetical protein